MQWLHKSDTIKSITELSESGEREDEAFVKKRIKAGWMRGGAIITAAAMLSGCAPHSLNARNNMVMVAGEAIPGGELKAEMTLDRPFIYGIQDNATGAWLFLGVCRDPSVES